MHPFTESLCEFLKCISYITTTAIKIQYSSNDQKMFLPPYL